MTDSVAGPAGVIRNSSSKCAVPKKSVRKSEMSKFRESRTFWLPNGVEHGHKAKVRKIENECAGWKGWHDRSHSSSLDCAIPNSEDHEFCCKLCPDAFTSSGGASNRKRHLKRKHVAEWEGLVDEHNNLKDAPGYVATRLASKASSSQKTRQGLLKWVGRDGEITQVARVNWRFLFGPSTIKFHSIWH